MVRPLSRIVTGGVTAIIAVAGIAMCSIATADADPPNMMPIPSQVPEAIDKAVAPPPFPHLRTIPIRARAPGFGHRIQELREALLPSPSGDPMFDRWPSDLAAWAPGTVIATRDVTHTAAPVVTVPIASATLLKFRSTDTAGQPVFGTATVVVPRQAPRGARPILVNNLPIDSLGTTCTPGYTLAHGFSSNTSFTDLFPPATQLALAHGYSVLIPDHEGPRMAYAEPVVAGRVILDALRALDNFDRAAFGASRVAMTGYSGGSIATSGAMKQITSYAPELAPRMVGAALGGVPADFRMLIGSMNANLATGLFHAATFGIARERTDILPMANNLAQWFATSPLKDICGAPAAIAGATMWPMQLFSVDPDPFRSPVAEEVYRATRMSDVKSAVPLYIYQGGNEWWIPAAGARTLFAEQCRLGVDAVYRELPGEHVTTAVAGFSDAANWVDQRLRGMPAPDGCRG